MTAGTAVRVADAGLGARERLIVALDVPTAEEAEALIARLGDSVTFYKIGLELVFGGGLALAEKLVGEGKQVFLDMKLHDIDQTVRGAVANVARLGVDFLTVHAQGRVMEAALAEKVNGRPRILGVTVLTSLGAEDLAADGVALSPSELVLKRAEKALAAGCDGVVASGKEAAAIRALAGDRLTIVTPGIRSAGQAAHDQKRVTTPADAIAAGSDYLVVGRQITGAEDPRAMAEQVAGEIDAALR